jgi:hypothetical protein
MLASLPRVPDMLRRLRRVEDRLGLRPKGHETRKLPSDAS